MEHARLWFDSSVKVIFPVLLGLFIAVSLLPVTPVSAATIPDGTYTIETIFYATPAKRSSDNSEWPRVAMYLNNGEGFDGPYDYRSCLTPESQIVPTGTTDLKAALNCDKPNRFSAKLLQEFEVNSGQFVHRVTVTKKQLLVQPYVSVNPTYFAKLSYAFHNDYWDGGSKDRNLSIAKITITDPQENNKTIATFAAGDIAFQNDYKKGYATIGKTVIYQDMGLINFDGQKTGEQDGMNAAFDKQLITPEVPINRGTLPFWKTEPDLEQWQLNSEGSLNFIFSLPVTPAAATTSNLKCKLEAAVTCNDNQATVRWSIAPATAVSSFSKYKLRLDGKPGVTECLGPDGKTKVGWYCGKSQGNGEDQVVEPLVSATTQVLTIAPGVPYSARISVDQDKQGLVVPTGACTSSTVTFTCPVTEFRPEDINTDSTVNGSDHAVLVQDFGKQGTAGFIRSDISKDGYVNIFDYNRLLAVLRSN